MASHLCRLPDDPSRAVERILVGKRILTIQIRKEGDQPVNLFQMFIREVIGKFLLGVITFGIASVVSACMIVIRKDKRAIHDLLAQTYVKNIP